MWDPAGKGNQRSSVHGGQQRSSDGGQQRSSVAGGQQKFQIAGHTVWFPCKPYPSQFSMMDKILRGLERQQNCLLESPTGSGKSLALLCSALAWQSAEKEKQEGACQCKCHVPKPATTATTTTTTITGTASATVTAPAAMTTAAVSGSVVDASGDSKADMSVSLQKSSVIVLDGDSDEDFTPQKSFREPGSKSSMLTKKKKARVSIEYEDTPPSSPSPSPCPNTHTGADTPATPCVDVTPDPPTLGTDAASPTWDADQASACSLCSCGEGPQKGAAKKVPKIYFGTRTHKQVAQIVRELRKTEYHDVAMTILASREHTCIHPHISRSANKNEGCEQLLKDSGCSFKDRMVRYQSQNAIKDLGLHSAWDLEDLVQVLKKKKACPYFVSRGLKDQSDLIICPYNYLVDPIIRDSMEINLKGQVVLLDEAHNIEDSVREAASQSITQDQVTKAMDDMDRLMERGIKVADISKLRQMCQRLDSFIEERSSSLTTHDFDQHYTIWSGLDIVAQLQRQGLGPRDMEYLKGAVSSIKAAEQEERQLGSGGQDVPTLTSATWNMLEQVFLVLQYMYKNDLKFAEDYRMSLVKSFQYVSVSPSGTWLNSRKHQGKKRSVEVFTLNFWCMNPAVGFADFECVRSVILTSGTLSPMESFQSELAQPFPITLEANHVIPDSQVWVGAVGRGPDGSSLKAVYQNLTSFKFQDSLGQLILQVCSAVPKGVLCFLPSYNALEKLTARWQQTGLWDRVREHKHVMCEPRGSDSGGFEENIRSYYRIISHGDVNEGVGGALFFAVCRGKVSEGLDFADDFARAVITVGIPYPNFKDIQVKLKKEYNDKAQSSRRLLSGSHWYEIQAFRALNQALGRCIRHRNDWGALIIVDDRFVQNPVKYSQRLSKWVRSKLRVHPNCGSMLSSLASFVSTRQDAALGGDHSFKSSQPPSTPLSPAPSPHIITPPSVFSPPPSLLSPPPPPSPHIGSRQHNASGVPSPPTHKLDRPLPVSTVVASTPAEQQESPPLPPLPYIAIKGDNRSPLHNVSNVRSPSLVVNIPCPLPSTPPSGAGQGRRTIHDGVAVTSCVATKTTTSDVCVVPSVREGSGVPECLPVGAMLPHTPSSETSIDVSDVSGENNVRAVTVRNISGFSDVNGLSGASNASAVSQVLGVSNGLLPATTTNTNPPTLVVRHPHQNHRHHPPSPNSTITQQHSAKTDNSLQIMSKAGRVTSSGKDPAMGVSAVSNRSLVQEQRSRLVTGSRSCGSGGVSADSLCEVTAAAGENRRGSNSASKMGAAPTSPVDSATRTVAGACDDRAEKTPFPAPVTPHVGLDLVPANDPGQKVITVRTVSASQLSASGTSPSLFPDSPNWASPGARPTGTGRSASSGGLQTAQSTSESPTSVDGRSPGVCAASSSVMTPPTLGKGTHPTQPSTASTHQDGRLPSATIIRSDAVRAKKPLFRNMATKRTELCPSRLQATAEMVGETVSGDLVSTDGNISNAVTSESRDGDGKSLVTVRSDADGGVEEGEEEEEEEVVVLRRVRTAKRRSLSLTGGAKRHRPCKD